MAGSSAATASRLAIHCVPFGFAGLGGHHVHLVVGQVAGDDRGQRRYVQDGGVRGVGLADPQDPQLVAFQVERVGGQQLRQHLLAGCRDLAGEQRYPFRPWPGSAAWAEDLGGGQAGGAGKAAGQPG